MVVLMLGNLLKSLNWTTFKPLHSTKLRCLLLPTSLSLSERNMGSSALNPPSSVRDKMDVRTAGIIIIGDEILKGDVKDENTHFLCKRFHALGVKVAKVSVVGDTLSAIADEVKKFSERYDVVVTTGGIGPTHDDVTYEGIARAFDEEMVTSRELHSFWKLMYPKSEAEGDENPAIKMSKIPKSARVIRAELANRPTRTMFPFVIISNIYVFPGIPMYLKAGFTALEKDHFTGWSTVFHNRTIYLNVHESHAVSALNKTSKDFASSVEIGSYPIVNNPHYLTKLTLESTNEEQVDKAYNSLLERLTPQWIVHDADFLGNAPTHLNNLLDSLQQDRFSHLINNAYQTVVKCYEKYKEEEVFLCFNGGKDCTALLHLVHTYLMEVRPKTKSKIQALYIRSNDSFQETEDFIQATANRYNLDMTVVDGSLKRSLEKLISGEKCHWKAVLMGTRRTDPHSAKHELFQKTDPGWPDLMRVSPFLDWDYQDIWHFIRKLNIPYCCLYDKGYTSLGSKRNTTPNPDLAYEENGVTKYRPAYTLENQHSERNGRS